MKGSCGRRHTVDMVKSMLSFLLSSVLLSGQAASEQPSAVPVATQWLYDAIAPGAKGTVDSVVRIWCKKTNAVGSGFILDTGYIITNNHVVQNCGAADLEVRTSTAAILPIADLWSDENRDLAAAKPTSSTKGIFKIDPTGRIIVGTELSAWGYPFAQPGPAPFLTVGHLSGFSNSQTEQAKPPVLDRERGIQSR
jgi:S1-C subfamily serine protease